ncbi:MAG: hypothetical protein WCX61_05280 [Candidatus Peribacteraceae bacterium]|jgi:hypothetical protein
MSARSRWQSLGWHHPVWDLVRYYCSLRGEGNRQTWLKQLKESERMSVIDGENFQIEKEYIDLLFQYLDFRQQEFERVFSLLRDEKEALQFCKKLGVSVSKTTTRNQEHHQSSKALIAAVTEIAKIVCHKKGLTLDANPQARCVWCSNKGLHVTARNLDGAVPSLANPIVIWEIKEYWGVTSGGSKMSDAVYEANLVGSELRAFEEHTGGTVMHVVFVDGKQQWSSRKSDLFRFIDLMHQGLIDHLLVGREVETEWESILMKVLKSNKRIK